MIINFLIIIQGFMNKYFGVSDAIVSIILFLATLLIFADDAKIALIFVGFYLFGSVLVTVTTKIALMFKSQIIVIFYYLILFSLLYLSLWGVFELSVYCENYIDYVETDRTFGNLLTESIQNIIVEMMMTIMLIRIYVQSVFRYCTIKFVFESDDDSKYIDDNY